MGSDDNIIQALTTLCERNNPRLIVLMSSGLSEAQGTDMSRALKEFRRQQPRFERVEVVTVATPDFYGSLENGHAALIESLITQLVPQQALRSVRKKRVNLLLSHMLTPGDVEMIRSVVEGFGLQPVMVPDLSRSMDGHLLRQDYLSVSQGGSDVNHIKQLGQSAMTFVIGPSLSRAGQVLEQRSGVESLNFPHLMTLEQMDRFVDALRRLADRAVPEWLDRQRGQLQDAMIDTHTWINGRHFGIAAEADLLVAWLDYATSIGMKAVSVVAPVNQPALGSLPVEQVLIGDLEDLTEGCRDKAELMLTNSHGALLAEQLNIPLLRIGFPIYDRFGEFRRVRQGYAGMRDTLFDVANAMQQQHHLMPAPTVGQPPHRNLQHGLG